MKTLADRVRWVLEAGRVPNARQWSLSAGLSSKVVSTFLERASRSDGAELTEATIRALAPKGGVHVDWLRSGIEPRDVYLPNRDAAVAELRLRIGWEHEIAYLLSPQQNEDMPVAAWLARADALRDIREADGLVDENGVSTAMEIPEGSFADDAKGSLGALLRILEACNELQRDPTAHQPTVQQISRHALDLMKQALGRH